MSGKPIVAKLVPPSHDKGWSFQLINLIDQEESKAKMMSLFADPVIKEANPFLQGNSNGWIMVEFWTLNHPAILKAADMLFKAFDLPVITVTNPKESVFTLEELDI